MPHRMWYNTTVSRCVGTGRRGGLKIRWANNPCGFDPRHRHQKQGRGRSGRGLAFCLMPVGGRTHSTPRHRHHKKGYKIDIARENPDLPEVLPFYMARSQRPILRMQIGRFPFMYGWPEVSSDGIPLCRTKYNGQYLNSADQNLSDGCRSKNADTAPTIP